MFVDTRNDRERNPRPVDLCIVGAGGAGIALALEFLDTPVRVVLLEGGGLEAEPGGQASYQVIPRPTPRLILDPTRMWFFGGMTNHWQANCRPLDEADFEPRHWIRYSGWPLRRRHLLPYYHRAQAVCGLSDFRWYDLEACRAQLRHPPLDADPDILTSRVLHTCPIPSFARLYRQRLQTADNIDVWLHARALRLRTNEAGDQVTALETRGPDGRRAHIEARLFVLATGGIENARLLLCSNDVSRNGLANQNDLVGRFFMEHWYVDIPLGRRPEFPDLAFYRERQPVGDARVWGQLVLSEGLMRRELVASLTLWFGSGSELSVALAKRLLVHLRGVGGLDRPLTDIRMALGDSGAVVRQVLRRLRGRGGPRSTGEGHKLRIQLEQTPEPENRVMLSPDRDPFGQPRATLALRLAPDHGRRYSRCLAIAAEELRLNGSRLARQLELRLAAGQFGSFWHHMGTTRMHGDPTQGVVDGDCRVHGVTNLFVAGSSVFPTAGSAPPTLTIVALALRLADHFRERFGLAGPARHPRSDSAGG